MPSEWHEDLTFEPRRFRADGAVKRTDRRRALAGITQQYAHSALAGFERGDHVFLVTKGQISMIDVIVTILDRTGPADVCLWTWVIADYEVEAIRAMVEHGSIRGLRMVIDVAGARKDKPIMHELQTRYGEDCLRVTKTHAKIAQIYNEEWNVLARGSMNLNFNPRFEQCDVSEGDEPARVMREISEELWREAPPAPVTKLTNKQAVTTYQGAGARDSRQDWARGLSLFEPI